MNREDRGTATVEVAVALPALVAVVAIALWGIAATAARLACVDALHTGARAAARGEPLPEVRARVLQATPPGTTLTITQTEESVLLTLTAPFRPPTHLPLPSLTFHLTAQTPTEPVSPPFPTPLTDTLLHSHPPGRKDSARKNSQKRTPPEKESPCTSHPEKPPQTKAWQQFQTEAQQQSGSSA